MTRAVLSIGSNVGDPRANLQAAVDAFRPWLVAVSPVYRTAPWGPIEQDDFRNAVLVVDDPKADARTWLTRGVAVEAQRARTREQRWGPRTLDVDVITVDDEYRDDPTLTVPHPRAAHRAFVLVPWHDVEPDAVLPGAGAIADLIAALPAGERAGVRLSPADTVR